MKPARWFGLVAAATILVFPACSPKPVEPAKSEPPMNPTKRALTKYVEVELESDLSVLSENERKMLPLLIDACRAMDDDLLARGVRRQGAAPRERSRTPSCGASPRSTTGPGTACTGTRPFLPGAGEKPKGAGYYPADMTKEEFEKACAESPARAASLKSQYTVVRRDAKGALVAVPFHEAFAAQVDRAAAKLEEAAELADDPGPREVPRAARPGAAAPTTTWRATSPGWT